MIRGNVLGAPESLDMFYPVEAGPLRLSDSVIIGGNVTDTRTPGYFIKAYNQTTDTIRPLATSESQALRIECSQQKLGPGDLATFVIYFKAGALGEYGPVELPVSFVADSASPDARSVTVPLRATVLPIGKILVRQGPCQGTPAVFRSRTRWISESSGMMPPSPSGSLS